MIDVSAFYAQGLHRRAVVLWAREKMNTNQIAKVLFCQEHLVANWLGRYFDQLHAAGIPVIRG